MRGILRPCGSNQGGARPSEGDVAEVTSSVTTVVPVLLSREGTPQGGARPSEKQGHQRGGWCPPAAGRGKQWWREGTSGQLQRRIHTSISGGKWQGF